MLPLSGLLILAAGRFWSKVHGDMPGSDEACTHMGIRSMLLVRHVHDALLFTDRDAILRKDIPGEDGRRVSLFCSCADKIRCEFGNFAQAIRAVFF